MHNILFVCSANKDRSATAEHYFAEHYPNLNFESAGTNEKICFQLGTTFISQELVKWADFILVMEQKHKQFIHAHFSVRSETSLRVLAVKDIYTFMEQDLIAILKKSISPLFDSLK